MSIGKLRFTPHVNRYQVIIVWHIHSQLIYFNVYDQIDLITGLAPGFYATGQVTMYL